MLDEPMGVVFRRSIDQIGIVVNDLDRALEMYSTVWGIGPWIGYLHSPDTVPTLTYRGSPGEYAMRVALAGASPEIELVEPLEGPSLYHEWVENCGGGIHHVGIIVRAVAEAVSAMTDLGYGVLQSGAGYGVNGDGGFAYFDTKRDFGVIVEAIEIPRVRRRPDFTWP